MWNTIIISVENELATHIEDHRQIWLETWQVNDINFDLLLQFASLAEQNTKAPYIFEFRSSIERDSIEYVYHLSREMYILLSENKELQEIPQSGCWCC